MDFSILYQLRTKKIWWLDVILYFAVSLLIAACFSYFVFALKTSLVKREIKDQEEALKTVGTQTQKDQETFVIENIKKINDFNAVFKNHRFASNAFAFMQIETMPYIWFKQFSLDQKNSSMQLSGQADNMDNFSRQVANFEKNKYVKKVGILNSSVSNDGKIEFSTSLALDQKIFAYISDLALIKLKQEEQQAQPEQEEPVEEATGPKKSSLKMITVFSFPGLDPEVSGQIDQEKRTIALQVPYGTAISSLAPSVIISPKAKVASASGVAKDFTKPVTYKVTAEDGTSQNYVVTVKILPKQESTPRDMVGPALILLIIILSLSIVAILIYKKMSAKKINPQLQ